MKKNAPRINDAQPNLWKRVYGHVVQWHKARTRAAKDAAMTCIVELLKPTVERITRQCIDTKDAALYEDLQQEAYIKLLKAVRRFDVKRIIDGDGAPCLYAFMMPRIEGAVQDALPAYHWGKKVYRTSGYAFKRMSRIRKAEARLSAKNGGIPTDEEVLAELRASGLKVTAELRLEHVAQLRRDRKHGLHSDPDNRTERAEDQHREDGTVPATAETLAMIQEALAECREEAGIVAALLEKRLPPRDLSITLSHLGWDASGPQTLQRVGRDHGVGESMACVVVKRAVAGIAEETGLTIKDLKGLQSRHASLLELTLSL